MEFRETLRALLLREFFVPATRPESLDDASLLTEQVLGPVDTLRLVQALEKQYAIEFTPQDLDPVAFDTLAQMAEVVAAKVSASAHARPSHAGQPQRAYAPVPIVDVHRPISTAA